MKDQGNTFIENILREGKEIKISDFLSAVHSTTDKIILEKP